MKSRITIDLDEDNMPCIKIVYQESDDVRDGMVKRFLESTHGATELPFRYAKSESNNTVIIRPCSFPELAK